MTKETEDVIKKLRNAIEQLRDRLIEWGISILKYIRDIFRNEESPIKISGKFIVRVASACYKRRKKFFRWKEKSPINYRYMPVIRRNLPYMRRHF